MKIALALLVADFVIAMLVVGTVVNESGIHHISGDVVLVLADVILEPVAEVFLVLGSKKRFAMVHEDVCAHANQATLFHLIITTAGQEEIVEIVGVVSQEVDVPVDHGVADIACVGGIVGEVLEDVVESSDDFRHAWRLSNF